MTFGVVLGGGGVVGVAWEIGVLSALEEAGLPTVHDASVVIGTSAGSVVGGRRLLGKTYAELAEEQERPDRIVTPTDDSGRDATAAMDVFRLWAGPGEMTQERAAAIGAKAVQAVSVDNAALLDSFDQLMGRAWPDSDFRVVAVRCADGARTVWTSASGVPLSLAVASSCAVPGMYTPVNIGDSRYTDGGVWSSGSADLLADTGVTSALFVGPMVGESGVGLVSRLAMESETRMLASRGITIHNLVPGDAFAAAGFRLMDPSRRQEALDVGRAEGKAAAARLGDALSAG
jgi:NTE family protein